MDNRIIDPSKLKNVRLKSAVLAFCATADVKVVLLGSIKDHQYPWRSEGLSVIVHTENSSKIFPIKNYKI